MSFYAYAARYGFGLADTLGVSQEALHAKIDRLVDLYSEQHRHYHTTNHLAAIFDLLNAVEDEPGFRASANSPALILAIWYHDAIYDPQAKDNEAQSAALARTDLTELGVGAKIIERTCTLIEATQAHTGDGADDANLMLDLDLAVLGGEEEAYASYLRGIRSEYRHIPEPIYRKARDGYLQGWLALDQIFKTPCFHQRFETQARKNIQAELTAGSSFRQMQPV